MAEEMTLDEVYSIVGDMGGAKELLYGWGGLNKWLFVKINSIGGGLYDTAMQMLSILGDRHNFPYWLAGLAAFVALTALLRLVRRKGGVRYYLVEWVGVFAVLGAGFVVNTAAVHIAKSYFHYPRPYIALARDEAYRSVEVRVLEQRKDAEDDYRSFPSGHVAFVTLLVAALWPMFSANMQWLGILFIVAEMWSRIAMGRHFPADAVGAVLIAWPLTVMVRAFVHGLLRRIGLNC